MRERADKESERGNECERETMCVRQKETHSEGGERMGEKHRH